MSDINTYIQKDFKLPSPPIIAIQILDAVKDEHATSRSLSRIISSDPALAARILKLANSSFYAGNGKIDSIDRAITLLGTETLKNIALSFAIARATPGGRCEGFDLDSFWRRSLTTAVGNNLLAEKMGQDKGNTFVTGLLIDIGMLFMYVADPEGYLDAFKEKLSSNTPLVETERAIFGFDHQEIGAAILKHWSFPAQIYRPIRHHHFCTDVPDTIRKETLLLGLAEKVSSAYHGSHTVERIKEIHRDLRHHQAIDAENINGFIDQVGEKSIEIISAFEIDPGKMKPYSQLLQEANQELGKLNLTYEQLILDLKQSKQKSDKLAAELKKANDKLRFLALKDGLTSLYNHTFFQDALLKEINKADRYHRNLSVILMDIDHFKSINDTYGHPMGDHTLKQVAQAISLNIRKADIGARYGGEEFAVILPETGLKSAVLLAERLRKIIEGTKISDDEGQAFGVTISAGVSTFAPKAGETLTTKELIKIADQALYQSKRNGRNRVSIYKK